MLWRKRETIMKVRHWKNRQNFYQFLQRQAHTAIQGELNSQRKLTEAESDMDIKEWERRNSEFAPCESQRELESQRLHLRQASEWADQAQRETKSLCGDLELRNRHHRENYTKSGQKIRRITKGAAIKKKLTQH